MQEAKGRWKERKKEEKREGGKKKRKRGGEEEETTIRGRRGRERAGREKGKKKGERRGEERWKEETRKMTIGERPPGGDLTWNLPSTRQRRNFWAEESRRRIR